ncbi:MAG: 5-formyltetrahydrofolate cyclo-ligase [Buchananella hordeovulneris]|nr:5-formyltetrahydrofolate cyclo-ligase [Buchananella hordeovulneris]
MFSASQFAAPLGLDAEDAKQAMRKQIRSNRLSRNRKDLQEDCAAITQRILEVCEGAKNVCIYVSVEGEPSTLEALEELRLQGVRVLVPVLGPALARTWGIYQGPEDLQLRNPGRPPEPSGDVLPAQALEECDVIITPALSVDTAGNRLGQGGGWYDRVLQHAKPSARVYALVFNDEVAPAGELPTEEHDKPVHAIITPDKLINVRS